MALYRGGTDESTFGPHFQMIDSKITNVGNGGKNKSGASVLLHGVQVTKITGSKWDQSAPLVINHTVGEPRTRIVKNQFDEMGYLQIKELNSQKQNTAVVDGNQVVMSN